MREQKNQVNAPCIQNWIDVDDTDFVNIEENIYGQDVLTYVCPLCNKEHKSLVVST